MIAFAKRNLSLYFRDKAAVFFSLLSIFITIGLYFLFLRNLWTDNLEGLPGAQAMIDHWEIAGILAITSVSSTLGMFGTMVSDKSNKAMITRDFYIAPVRRSSLTMGYFIAALVVGIIMTTFALIFMELFCVLSGGQLLSPLTLLKVFGMIVLTSFTNTTMMLLLVSLFSSMNAFSTASTIVGTLISFITGIYLPIGMYPTSVQYLIKLFPTSHAAVIFRQLTMEDSMAVAFQGVPEAVVLEIKQEFGVVYTFGDYIFPIYGSILVLIVSSILFLMIASITSAKKKRKF